MSRRLPLLLAFVAFPSLLLAQDRLTPGSIAGNEFAVTPGAPVGEWLQNGKAMLANYRGEVVSVSTVSGAIRVLIPKARLGKVQPEAVSLVRGKVLIFANSRKVWRLNTRGDYFVYDLDTKRLQRVGPKSAPSQLMFAKLSPDGRRVGYVWANNLYVQELATGRIIRLTKDGAEKRINGTSDWVYEEELGVRDGWRWSPDSSKIAYWQFDTTPEPVFTMINYTDTAIPTLKRFPFPFPGGKNANVRVGVVPAKGGRTKWMAPTADSANGYINSVEWAANSRELLIQKLNRLQNRREYLLANTEIGNAKLLYADEDKAWVEPANTGPNGVAWASQGKKFVIFSERSGWRHLWSVDRNGATTDLTPGNFDVDATPVQIAGDTVYFSASPGDSTQRHLFRTSISRPRPMRVTPNGEGGSDTYTVSPSGAFAIREHTSVDDPGAKTLVSLPEHTLLRVLDDRQELRKKIQAITKGTTERRTFLAADGRTELDGYLTFPPDFDPAKKYPVFFEVYGGPSWSTARDEWRGESQLYRWLLAQKGYVVATVDNRGTDCLKGRDWRKLIFKRSFAISSADQTAAAKQIASLPFVDSSRLGIWGWSSGGMNVLHCLFRYPEVWALGISVAPVTDTRLYDTIYTERYTGLPSESPEAYRDDAALTFAKNLKGQLLLVHGTGDDNSHYGHTERLINELVKHGKAFTVMPYPNRTHEINEGAGTYRHLFELMVRFLTTNMPPR